MCRWVNRPSVIKERQYRICHAWLLVANLHMPVSASMLISCSKASSGSAIAGTCYTAMAVAAAVSTTAILNGEQCNSKSLHGDGMATAVAAEALTTAIPNGEQRDSKTLRAVPSSINHCHHQAVFAAPVANLVVITLLSVTAIPPCNIWSAVAAAISCLRQTPSSSLVTLLIVEL